MPEVPEVPSRDSLIAVTRVATTAAAFRHAVDEITAIFKKARVLDKFEDLMSKFDAQLAALVDAESRVGEQIWAGAQPVMSDAHIITPKVESGSDEPIQVSMKVGFENEQNEQNDMLVRSYVANGVPPDEPMTKGLDAFFHGWLQKEGLLCRDQLIYEADESGEIKTDNAGEPIQIDPAALKERLENENSGLVAYVNAQNGPVTLQLSVETDQVMEKAKTIESNAESNAEPDIESDGPG